MTYKIIYEHIRNNNKFQTASYAPICEKLFRKFGFLITPFFIKLHIKAYMVSLLGLLIGVISAIIVAIGNDLIISIGVSLFFIARTIDFCDGNVARMEGDTTFFGRLIDGHVDITNTFLIRLALASAALHRVPSESLMWFGVFSSVLWIYQILMMDRYSVFARWINSDYGLNITPYIIPSLSKNFRNTLYNLEYISLITIAFFPGYSVWEYLLWTHFLVVICMSLYIIGAHTWYSYQNMRIPEKIK